MLQFVKVLVARFRMSVAEIVLAYCLVSPHTNLTTRNPQSATSPHSPKNLPPRNDQVDQALLFNPSLLRCYSIRPIFLGCCVLAFKMTRDQQPASLSYLHSLVQDVFNLLEVRLLVRIEHQLLEVQSSQPAPNPTASPSHLCLSLPAPMRRRCWAGGFPWGQDINSMPTRSSARQRTRSLRRPCRPHRSSGRGNRPWILRSSLTVHRCGKGRSLSTSRRGHPRRTTTTRCSAPFPYAPSTSPLQTRLRARRRGQQSLWGQRRRGHGRSQTRRKSHHHHHRHWVSGEPACPRVCDVGCVGGVCGCGCVGVCGGGRGSKAAIELCRANFLGFFFPAHINQNLFCRKWFIENEPTAPAEQAHATPHTH